MDELATSIVDIDLPNHRKWIDILQKWQDGGHMTEIEMLALLAAHENDPDAHDLLARLQILTDAIEEQRRRAWLPAATDNFNRPDGPIAGTTLQTGQTWRNASGTTSGSIINNRFASLSGNAVAMFDLPGIEISGRTLISFAPTVGNGDAWIYAGFRESASTGVLVQRGSDRVRLYLREDSTLTVLGEFFAFPSVNEIVTVVLDIPGRRCRVDLAGKPVIPDTVIPPKDYGLSIGVRVGGTATIDNLSVFRELLL